MVYRGNVDDVEAFPGMLAEDRERGSGVGRMMREVWESECIRLRDDDQFCYERTSRFPDIIRRQLSDWVQKIRARGGITLRDIILCNSGIRRNQLPADNIFRLDKSQISAPRSPTSSDSTPRPPKPPSQDPAPRPPRPPSSDLIPSHPTHLPQSLVCGAYVCCAKSCGKCEADKCAERLGRVDVCRLVSFTTLALHAVTNRICHVSSSPQLANGLSARRTRAALRAAASAVQITAPNYRAASKTAVLVPFLGLSANARAKRHRRPSSSLQLANDPSAKRICTVQRAVGVARVKSVRSDQVA